MVTKINKEFHKIIINSLNTKQIDYLGKLFDRSFDLYRVSGFRPSIPIPRQTAADTLLYFCNEDEDVVKLFSILLRFEGEHFYDRTFAIWGKNEFLTLLKLNKWIYDPEMKQFFLDPFYEHEINFLKKIRIIDLRGEVDVKEIVDEIATITKKMGIKDLEWRIALRLYDLNPQIAELIRKILDLLLVRQNLQLYTGEMFFCLKELAINAGKANYKLLFDKYITSKKGITAERNYSKFLELFRLEIEENGNENLLALAKKDDRHFTITFQSSKEAIEVWVTNDQNVTYIEKEQILKKINPERLDNDTFIADDDENTEGAGLGLSLVINLLKNYTGEEHPLKVVFYPDFIKIGFELKRSDLLAKKPSNE